MSNSLSLRRLSGENLLPHLSSQWTLSIPKSGCIKSHFEESYPFPPKTGENQIHASVVFNIFKFEIKKCIS